MLDHDDGERALSQVSNEQVGTGVALLRIKSIETCCIDVLVQMEVEVTMMP